MGAARDCAPRTCQEGGWDEGSSYRSRLFLRCALSDFGLLFFAVARCARPAGRGGRFMIALKDATGSKLLDNILALNN
jgi:hypothetical protein